jgi:hypothetical protein
MTRKTQDQAREHVWNNNEVVLGTEMAFAKSAIVRFVTKASEKLAKAPCF